MDGWTHKLHTKQNTPLPCMVMGGNNFYLSQNGVSKRSELTPFFSDKTKRTINFLWVPGELSKSQTRNQRRTTTLVIPSSVRPLAADKKYFVLHLRKPSP